MSAVHDSCNPPQECQRRISGSVIDRVAEAVADPRKCLEFSGRDRDALALLRTIMDFDLATGLPPVGKHPWLRTVDHILWLIDLHNDPPLRYL